MPKIKNSYFLLLLVFFLGTFLRFYQLSQSPPGLYVDETAIGYNAYSILETGRDEYGKAFPLFFRSFGDYKMPLYVYATAVSVKLFGLSAFSVRFMSAFFGSASILLIFFLTGQLFPKKSVYFCLLVSFLFAIAPWSLFFSRVAFEASLALFFLLLGLSLELSAFKRQNTRWLMLSMLAYALSVYSYHTERFLAPVLVLVFSYLLLRLSGKSWPGGLKRLVTAIIFFLILISPQFWFFSSPAGQARIRSLFIGNGQKTLPQRVAMYTAYFSLRNLFFDPDPDPQRSYPELSVFYSWMAVPCLWGLYLLVKKRENPGNKVVICFMLLAPVPASLAKDPFSAIRSYPLVFPLIVVISLGIENMVKAVDKKLFVYFIGILAITVSLLAFWRSAFIIMRYERFAEWNYGYAKMTENLLEKNYSHLLINDPLGVSYSELLFYMKYPPRKLQSQSIVDLEDYYNLGKWDPAVSWDNVEVRGINWEKDIFIPQLIVATPLAISESQAEEHFFSNAFVIIGPRNETVFNGYLTNPEAKIKDNERKLRLIKK